AITMEGLGVDAIGVNCSLGPKELEPVVAEFSKWTTLPLAIKPNAGLPDPITNKYDVTPEDFAESMANLVKYGVKIAGGCCGTDPEFIRAVVNRLKNMKYTPQLPTIEAAVCSPAKTVVIDQPRIIGERINPTGKKLFKEALKRGDVDYILGQAIEQINAGADILDVNVGLPDIDEKEMMVKVVKALQGVTDLPLQLDSTRPDVLEAALRVYNGKPIVNSVNGEEGSLEAILPIVKKYGAAVVGLALDEGGIPKTAEGRFEIAEKILGRAEEIGIPKWDVFIDCLTLTASAEQAAVMETLKALNRVKTELGLKTVLGVSNISFGLPSRELVNCNFLQMALTNGLDLPIINPNAALMTGAVRAYKLLTNIDKNSAEFIAAYANNTLPASVSGEGCVSAGKA
ncbi:MAG: dihydropteroate synthase, partial [Oscillospiraceae bacterium]|nr:dihydropteroate synthase [Oscillospiraceae bacterium]